MKEASNKVNEESKIEKEKLLFYLFLNKDLLFFAYNGSRRTQFQPVKEKKDQREARKRNS